MPARKTIRPANDNAGRREAVSQPIQKLIPLIELLARQAATEDCAARAANDNACAAVHITDQTKRGRRQSGRQKKGGRRDVMRALRASAHPARSKEGKASK